MSSAAHDPALGRGLSFLLDLQHPDGAVTAFDDTIFDVWETVNAARAIVDLGGSRRAILRALRFVESTERADGWVLHTSDLDEGRCLETTSEYASLMLAAGGAPDRAVRLVAAIRDAQTPFGCWAIHSPSIAAGLQTFPSATAFAWIALRDWEVTPIDLDGARLFLRASQNAHGHWGSPWQFYGTPYYAMTYVLEALRDDRAAGEIRGRSRSCLRTNQTADGSWCGGTLSPALNTALATRAALAAGVPPRDEAIHRAVAYLRGAQRSDGGWDGGTFPLPSSIGRVQREDVYATAQALRALYAVARSTDQ